MGEEGVEGGGGEERVEGGGEGGGGETWTHDRPGKCAEDKLSPLV